MSTNPYEVKRRLVAEAKDRMLRGAAALTEIPTTDVMAFAILECAMAMLKLAEADADESARKHLTKALNDRRRETDDRTEDVG